MRLLSLSLLATILSIPSVSEAQDMALQDVDPARIAQDVRVEYDPRSGEPQQVGPTFDPFVEDPALAGSVNLRSVGEAIDLDGRILRDGVLLDVSLYYNREGDIPFERTRDAVFFNGEPVPIVLRDRNELECSSRVTETIYTADRYYGGGGYGYGGLFRPRPSYFFGFGHYPRRYRGYGRGYGYGHGYYPGYGYGYDRPRRRPKRRDPVRPTPRPHLQPGYEVDDSGRGRPRNQRDIIRLDSDGKERPLKPVRPRTVSPPPQPRGTDRPRRKRPDAVRPVRRDDRVDPRFSPDMRVSPQPRIPAIESKPNRKPEPRREIVSRPRPDMSRERSRPTRTERPEHTAPQPRPQQQPRSKPKARSKPKERPSSRPNSRPSPRRESGPDRRRLEFFPGNGYDDTVVVSAVRDCAYEERLTLFIPNERLDAARFDGLGVVIRDVVFDPRLQQTTVYGEDVIEIPPNYIEGFRQSLAVPPRSYP